MPGTRRQFPQNRWRTHELAPFFLDLVQAFLNCSEFLAEMLPRAEDNRTASELGQAHVEQGIQHRYPKSVGYPWGTKSVGYPRSTSSGSNPHYRPPPIECSSSRRKNCATQTHTVIRYVCIPCESIDMASCGWLALRLDAYTLFPFRSSFWCAWFFFFTFIRVHGSPNDKCPRKRVINTLLEHTFPSKVGKIVGTQCKSIASTSSGGESSTANERKC